MEDLYPAIPIDNEYKPLYDEYERIFGERPPDVNDPEDYYLAWRAVEDTRAMIPELAVFQPGKSVSPRYLAFSGLFLRLQSGLAP